ncbi:MAG: HPr family phosphocarrier protein [Akkermansia sp.]
MTANILGLMMLAVGHGSKITITAEGRTNRGAECAGRPDFRKFEED